MQFKYKILAGALTLLLIGLFSYYIKNSSSPATDSPSFSEGINQKVKTAFLKVWQNYSELHSYSFELVQKHLSASTMEARPVIDLGDLFSNKRRYRINVAEKVLDSGDLLISDLPERVLEGWFAHELGHIIDYENHSNLGMVVYGIRYSLSDEYKRQREHEADSIAIRHGFRAEIVATKKYLLHNDFISPTYQAQLKKYYMSVRGAELCPDERIPVLPEVNL
ncbi:hypothetical protein PBT90_08700 [Algoriphagus halophytocola]|uniref:Peptidase n=1 Tax=Algoriphagus halophytocola TaxID=2991499 RepID=A0ABY6MI46_9BACT|nr:MULTISPECIES: hypothetical protein [unclassified Algoriphagus]UZD23465.1 hypothetical protein OM944_03020 [Algoriphagus sp. TR-M5]WBL44760.1 hypothetical protein PBT90_08700 [Algoriphagus sp. TR-M9]